MIEAIMIWNEPNNRAHWDAEVDPDWTIFSAMAALSGQAISSQNDKVLRVLGGISPIDPNFITNIETKGALAGIDVVAVHGFPWTWSEWLIEDWPRRVETIAAVTNKPIWVTEAGVSTHGMRLPWIPEHNVVARNSEELQAIAIDRTAEVLSASVSHIFWYSLYDLPRSWGACTPFGDGSDIEHEHQFHMGLLTEDGRPKVGLEAFARNVEQLGICQWFHFEDPRLTDAMTWLSTLGVRRVRTGLSWADTVKPGWQAWFDRQMQSLERFDVTLTLCFTPECRGIRPHHSSPPVCIAEFAEFCALVTKRYAS